MSTKPSVNLYCILARESPAAVVFRRGPAELVQLLLWDRRTDLFEEGQWLKGRIYERYCDLSPSGRYLVYWAGNFKPPFYHWTAVSRPPYLTAIALWPNYGAYGGGLFESEERLLLSFLSKPDKKGNPLPNGFEVEQWIGEFDCALGHIVENRLSRDGWDHFQNGFFRPDRYKTALTGPVSDNSFCILERDPESPDASGQPGVKESFGYQKMEKGKILDPFDPIDIWRKQCGRNILEMRTLGLQQVGGPRYPAEYRVISAETESVIFDLGRADWADWDTTGDLLYAQGGCIFRVHSNKLGSQVSHKLIDLTDAKFQPLEAPSEFQRW